MTEYVKIKDNCCIVYTGQNPEDVLALLESVPAIEATYPGLHVYICCPDILKPSGQIDQLFGLSDWEKWKNHFCFVFQLEQNIPVKSILEAWNVHVEKI